MIAAPGWRTWSGSELVFAVRRLAADGLEAWRQVIERGYEGWSPRTRRARTRARGTKRWLKVKQKDWTIEEGQLAAQNRGALIIASSRTPA